MLLHPSYILVDVGCVDDEEEVVLAHLVDEQVVDGAAVLIAHHAIEHLSVGGSLDVIGEDVLNIALGIFTLDGYFAHVRNVEDAAMLAHSVVLLLDVAVLDRHVKACKRGNEGSQSHVSVVETSSFVFHSYVDIIVD